MAVASDDDILAVPGEITEALALLREQRKRLEDEMSAGGKKYSAKHTAAAGSLSQALKALSAEARQWAAQLATVAIKATPEQRTAAAIHHLSRLPDGPRLDAYRRLTEAEAANIRPTSLRLA
jgi:hypothetical protein